MIWLLEQMVKGIIFSWMAQRYGMLTSSHFVPTIITMNNPHSSNIQRHLDDLFAPKNADHIPAIKWVSISRQLRWMPISTSIDTL